MKTPAELYGLSARVYRDLEDLDLVVSTAMLRDYTNRDPAD